MGSFSRIRFFEWCEHRGIKWPYTKSKITGKFKQSLKDDVMEIYGGTRSIHCTGSPDT